jgi:hypothetical protein
MIPDHSRFLSQIRFQILRSLPTARVVEAPHHRHHPASFLRNRAPTSRRRPPLLRTAEVEPRPSPRRRARSRARFPCHHPAPMEEEPRLRCCPGQPKSLRRGRYRAGRRHPSGRAAEAQLCLNRRRRKATPARPIRRRDFAPQVEEAPPARPCRKQSCRGLRPRLRPTLAGRAAEEPQQGQEH